MLPVAMDESSDDCIKILPVLWMTSCFHVNEHWADPVHSLITTVPVLMFGPVRQVTAQVGRHIQWQQMQHPGKSLLSTIA